MKRRRFLRHSGAIALGAVLPGRMIFPQLPSGFIRVACDEKTPAFSFFAIDGLGHGKLTGNLVLPAEPDGTAWRVRQEKNETKYFAGSDDAKIPVWELNTGADFFTLDTRHIAGLEKPFRFFISQLANHATLLGKQNDGPGHLTEKKESRELLLPALLHFPDMGTLRITASRPGAALLYRAKRFIDHPYVEVVFPAADQLNREVRYRFEVVSIHPDIGDKARDPAYDCFRRNFISIFQLNPFLGILANNSASDACAFTLCFYATMARETPALAEGLTAMDLLRETLDRYLAGRLGYGQLGYDYDKTWDIPESASSCNYLDCYPSLLISAAYYVLETKDLAWFRKQRPGLELWVEKMLSTDSDGDGLLEFCLSGNSGSWKGDSSMRPANWWDTIGFGHKDAYSNALAFHALQVMTEVYELTGLTELAEKMRTAALKLKAAYLPTFYNEKTGVLAGWRSRDGRLHDYYFTFVNSVAICYGLIDTATAGKLMDRLLAKMKAVGFTDFGLGLPGNLIPVVRADYTDLKPEVGGGVKEDNSDGFQIYENGGATACFAYFSIRALQLLGRRKEADTILLPLLDSMSAGHFQGTCPNGKTRDWKSWKGECWGYEGFLVDNYLFLLTVIDR